jgi:hypothetical protein
MGVIPKPKKVKLSTLRNKCNRLLQEIGRLVYDRCLVCGGEYSCLHHYVYKSQSEALRYDWRNCVPICVSCHFKIHNAKNDVIPGRIAVILGNNWINDLEERRKEGRGLNYGVFYYRQKLEELQDILNKLNSGEMKVFKSKLR